MPVGWSKGVQDTQLKPFKTVKFGPTIVTIPQNPLPYLDDYYGKNWLIISNHGHYHQSIPSLIKPKRIPFYLDENDRAPALPDTALIDNKHKIKKLFEALPKHQ